MTRLLLSPIRKALTGLVVLAILAGGLWVLYTRVTGGKAPLENPLRSLALPSIKRELKPPPAPPPQARPRPGPGQKGVIYLTIDGGPSSAFNAKVLPVLKAHNCRVTFFVVGQYLTQEPQAVAQLSRVGHEIEIHTWTHPHLTRLTDEQIRQEVQRTADTILKQTGQRPGFVRPPYGDHNKRTDEIIGKMGYRVAMWDVTCADYSATNPDYIVNSITKQVRPGAVVLLHVTRQTWKALPQLLTRLDAMGYQYALLRDRR